MVGRAWRYGLLGVGTVIVLALATGVVLLAEFDPNSLKPRIEAAVQQATGRDLGLYGPISVKWSLWPTVQALDVTFANPPGFSRPQMATLERLDLQLAVLSLLRSQFEIARLVLVHPDILLETDAQGHANWQFTRAPAAAPEVAPSTPPPSGGSPSQNESAALGRGASSVGNTPITHKTGTEIGLHNVRIENGSLAWRDDHTGKTDALTLKQFAAKSTSPDAPLTLAADASYNGAAFRLDGQVGSLDRLRQPDANTPWPVKLTLAAAGATVSVDGALTHPLQGRGYALTLDGTIPDLTAPDLTAIALLLPNSLLPPLSPGTRFLPMLSDTRLPPLHDIRLVAQISDSGGTVPNVEAVTLHLGAADLGGYVAGLHIVSVDIDAPQQNQPVRIAAQGSVAGTPLALTAMVRSPGGLLPGQWATRAQVDGTLVVANASLTVKGSMADPETLSGADLAIGATIPDLSMLSPLARRGLPTVTQIAFQGQLTDAPGGFRHGATLRGIKLTTADGDLSGEIGVSAGPPPTLTGNLHADRIDADALLAALGKPVAPKGAATVGTAPQAAKGVLAQAATTASPRPVPAASPSGAQGTPPSAPTVGAPIAPASAPAGPDHVPQPASNTAAPAATTATSSAAASGASPAAPGRGSPPDTRRLFPDTPIPLGPLRKANADLTVSVGDLKTGGSDYRAIELHAVLQDGKLHLAPLTADLPEGRLDASLTVDATAANRPFAVTLHAPGLEAAPLLAAAGLPDYASGRLEIYADLHGAGDTPHEIAAGISGNLGLAMQNGTVDTQSLARWLEPVLKKANLPGLPSQSGSTDLRCFALRADLRDGVAEFRALALNSSKLTMDGTGSVNLGDETFALQLRPQGRLARTVIVVPLRLTGPIRSPAIVIDGLGAAAANAGAIAGTVIGSTSPLGLLGSMLGGSKLPDGGSGESCTGPLALARGEAAPTAGASSAQAQPKPVNSGVLLHELFR